LAEEGLTGVQSTHTSAPPRSGRRIEALWPGMPRPMGKSSSVLKGEGLRSPADALNRLAWFEEAHGCRN